MSEEISQPRMIGALLRIPFQATTAWVYDGLVAAGYDDLSPAQLSVFQHMPPGGIRLTDLAEAAQITKQSMGYLVDHLERRGYVERVPDPADRRAKIVRLTDRGRDVETVARGVLRDVEAEWTNHLGVARMEALRSALADLVRLSEG